MRVEDMNAAEHMAYCAELGLDLETTLAVLRGAHPQDEVDAAYAQMPPEVCQSWLETIRQIPVPKKKNFF